MFQSDSWSAAVHHIYILDRKKYFVVVRKTVNKHPPGESEFSQKPHTITSTLVSFVTACCRKTRKYTVFAAQNTSLNTIRFYKKEGEMPSAAQIAILPLPGHVRPGASGRSRLCEQALGGVARAPSGERPSHGTGSSLASTHFNFPFQKSTPWLTRTDDLPPAATSHSRT